MILFYFSLMFQFVRNPSLNKTKQKHEKQKQNKFFFNNWGEKRGVLLEVDNKRGDLNKQQPKSVKKVLKQTQQTHPLNATPDRTACL